MSEEQQAERQFTIQRIYTKDVSFEAPNTPLIFQENWNPEISIGLSNEVKKIEEGLLELILKVTVEAKHEDKNVFMVEVAQGGLFVVKGFGAEDADALMGIAAPNVLFPYVREVISDLVTRGSFPQFVLQPVNFDAVYAQKQQQLKEQKEKAEAQTSH
jgi:preprotein translocase subunit SecB